MKRKRSVETELEKEHIKRRKLESEVKRLEKATKQQSRTIVRLKNGCSDNTRGSSSKPWEHYSRQQQYNIWRAIATEIQVFVKMRVASHTLLNLRMFIQYWMFQKLPILAKKMSPKEISMSMEAALSHEKLHTICQ